MLSLPTLLSFATATFLIAITPGPDQIYIATQSLARGKLAGFVSALGIHTGILVHVLLAALGLSAIVAASPLAFNIMKYAGAAYLIYLGVSILIKKSTGTTQENSSLTKQLSHIYKDGLVINLLNPRAMLFFFAFLPQFVSADSGNAGFQIVSLGLVAVAVSFPIDAGIGLTAGSLKSWLEQQAKLSKRLQGLGSYLTAFVFIALGCVSALSGRL